MSEQQQKRRRAAPVPEAPPVRIQQPRATATIGPAGPSNGATREHVISLTLELGSASSAEATATARRALGDCAALEGVDAHGDVRDVFGPRREAGGAVAVEATMRHSARPAALAVESMRAGLADAGYRVVVRERRECGESGCHTDCFAEWDRPDLVPSGWFTTAICGRHDYRRCRKCPSIYRMTSTNAVGQAPSLHCEVCGTVLIEWGGSKLWEAQRVVSPA